MIAYVREFASVAPARRFFCFSADSCFQLGELNSIYAGNYKKAVKYYSEVKTLTEEPLWLIKIEEKLAEINFTYLKNYTEALKNYHLEHKSVYNDHLDYYIWYESIDECLNYDHLDYDFWHLSINISFYNNHLDNDVQYESIYISFYNNCMDYEL